MESKYARASELKLTIENKGGKTVLSDAYFTPPFKIMKPFYEKNLMRILQMSASPGLMSGDLQQIDISVLKNTRSEMYSQSFEKIHKMESGQAQRNINISVAENCLFIYNPLPTIPYADSAMSNTVKIELADDSSAFVYSDILIGGRIARGESFAYRYYNSIVNIYQNGSLTYRDNTSFKPSEMNMSSLGFYEGYTHLLNMVICNTDIREDVDVHRFFENYSHPYGITVNHSGYVIIKALGRNAQQLMEISDEIKASLQ
jgi:urease accessory protein